jgi:hypothetical protein
MNKAYLDTCVISGLAKEDIALEEQNALLIILKAQKSGDLKLVTSDFTRRELDNIPEKYRHKHEVIYNLVADVPIAKAFRTDAGLMLMGAGGGVRLVKEMAQLATLLKDKNDAAHIYQAFKNEIYHFLTVDSRTIISQKEEIEKICGVLVMSPTEYVTNYIKVTQEENKGSGLSI